MNPAEPPPPPNQKNLFLHARPRTVPAALRFRLTGGRGCGPDDCRTAFYRGSA